MTPETRKNLRELSKFLNQMSRKQGKITKADIKKLTESIFSIIDSGDVEVWINPTVLNIARKFFKE